MWSDDDAQLLLSITLETNQQWESQNRPEYYKFFKYYNNNNK